MFLIFVFCCPQIEVSACNLKSETSTQSKDNKKHNQWRICVVTPVHSLFTPRISKAC